MIRIAHVMPAWLRRQTYRKPDEVLFGLAYTTPVPLQTQRRSRDDGITAVTQCRLMLNTDMHNKQVVPSSEHSSAGFHEIDRCASDGLWQASKMWDSKKFAASPLTSEL